MTRGNRNNNPLNIRHSKDYAFVGELSPDHDGFACFTTRLMGLRAAFCIFRTYWMRYGLRTIEDMITRWAPPTENHTDIYVSVICQRTNYHPTDEMRWDTEVAVRVIIAMAWYESRMIIEMSEAENAQKAAIYGSR